MEQIIIQPDQKLQIHPAATMMPMMTPDEWAQLKADIQENGLKEPVVLYKGQLLDGRNRFRVCRELNIPIQAVSLSEEEDPYLHVASLNLHRRQLTTSQKAAVAAKIMEQIKPKPGQKRRDIAGEAFGVSPKLVQGARKLLQDNPKMFMKVFKGEYTVSRALRKESAPKTSPAIQTIRALLALIPMEERQELEKIQGETSSVYAPIVRERIKEISLKPLNEHIEQLNSPQNPPPPVIAVKEAQPVKITDDTADLGILEPEFGF